MGIFLDSVAHSFAHLTCNLYVRILGVGAVKRSELKRLAFFGVRTGAPPLSDLGISGHRTLT